MDNNTVFCNDKSNDKLNHIYSESEPYNVYAHTAPQNIIYKSDSIAKVYDSAFGDAIDDYNSKSARKGEIKYTRNTYFKFFFGVSPDSETAQKCLTSNKRGSDKTKSFHEIFVQIGNCKEFGHFIRDDNGNLIDKNGNPVNPYIINNANDKMFDIGSFVSNPKSEIAKEILSVFYHGGHYQKTTGSNGLSYLNPVNDKDETEDSIFIPSFEERNQNFHVVTAIEHNDDLLGVPYLHIKFVPVGTNYRKGPCKQLGFHRALADMGFTNKQTAFTKWIQKERSILETICNYYGIDTNTEPQMIRMSDCLTEKCINESTARCKAAEEEANSIIERAKQEAFDIREMANSDAEKIKTAAIKAAEEIKAKSQQEYYETKRQFDAIIAKTEKTSNEIIQKSQRDASEIKEQSISKANEIKKEAEEYAKALKLKTEQEISVLHEQADKKMREAETRVIDKQKEYDWLLERSVKLNREIDFNRSSLLYMAETAKKFPCVKFYHPHYECERYEVDKYEYDLFMEFSETIVSLIKNHFTSYYDQIAIEHERERAKLLNDKFEKNIQEKEIELADKEIDYSERALKQRNYILGTAQKIAEHISASFAKQDRDTQIHQLNSALNKFEAEEFNKRLKSHLPHLFA